MFSYLKTKSVKAVIDMNSAFWSKSKPNSSRMNGVNKENINSPIIAIDIPIIKFKKIGSTSKSRS